MVGLLEHAVRGVTFIAQLVEPCTSAVCGCGERTKAGGCASPRWIVEYETSLIARLKLRHWCGIYCQPSLRVLRGRLPRAPLLSPCCCG